MKTNGQSKEEKPPKKPPLNSYVKYSAMGFQMLAAISLGVLGGVYLDGHYPITKEFPLFTVVGSLLGVFLALYLPLKDLLNK